SVYPDLQPRQQRQRAVLRLVDGTQLEHAVGTHRDAVSLGLAARAIDYGRVAQRFGSALLPWAAAIARGCSRFLLVEGGVQGFGEAVVGHSFAPEVASLQYE